MYIPKAGKPGQERPLCIPTIRNRVAQAIVKNALEPRWEAQFESNSYGFRPGRSIHDAIEHCFKYLNGRSRRPWILDADLESPFDKISHEHILKAIGPMPGRRLIEAWLKAGYVEEDFFHETDSGTPQGGIISPVLLNVALHGLQQALGSAFGYVRYWGGHNVNGPLVRSHLMAWLTEKGIAPPKNETQRYSIRNVIHLQGRVF